MNNLAQINVDKTVKGTIFDFKRFATADGSGIRGLIFLKGCPLQCKWCANPESQNPKPEIMYYSEKCRGCGDCMEACPVNAIKEDEKFGLVTDEEKCEVCGECVDACLYDAREIMGEKITVGELMSTIRSDRQHYDNSGGGITLTGGEVLYQCKFTRELLKSCTKANIHTAIETTGYSNWECIESILPYLDLIFFDFKHIDSNLHEKYTGVRNDLIKENLSKLNEVFEGTLVVRIPFIPNHNDDDEIQRKMYQYISQFDNVKRIEIMPYHRLGVSKYYGLGRDYALEGIEALNRHELEYLKDLGSEYDVDIQIDAR